MVNRAWGEVYRSTTVCIDSYENGVLNGSFYNPYMDGGTNFQSTSQFLLETEKALDEMDFPKPFNASRTFTHCEYTVAGPPETDVKTGILATFALKILFRQNSSWQGTITWLEGGQEQSFRSALELILLMDSALNHSKAS